MNTLDRDLTNASRDELLRIIAMQTEVVAALQSRVKELESRVKELEDRLATNSHNSSKPPSTDQSRGQSRSLRQPSGKKPEGQPGHPGQTLRISERPDRIVDHRPADCAACGASLVEVWPSEVERRQVIDLPPLQLEIVEHRVERLKCPSCGQSTSGTFPPEATQPVQYGPRLVATGVYLQAYQLLPFERTQELIEDLFGTAPSTGTLQSAIERCAGGLVETEAKIKQELIKAEVDHCDETGFYLDGQRKWLHVTSTPTLTYYGWHSKRGKKATDEMGILPKLRGYMVHDGWSSYFAYKDCRHGLCNVHHLRELTFIEERWKQPWSTEMKEFLLEAKDQVAEAKAAGQSQLAELSRQKLDDRYGQILEEGFRQNPPAEGPRPPGQRGPRKQSKARNLLERLRNHESEVLVFIHDFRVPFDNSQAERDIRMMKLQQKISGCFRSEHGATAFCRIRSYLSTVRKQGQPMLTAIERVLMGNPLSVVIAE